MNDSGSYMNRAPGASGGNKTWLYVVIGVGVLCVLCVAGAGVLTLLGINFLPRIVQNSQPTAVVQQQEPQQQTSGSYIQQITLAKEVAGEAFDPVNPTTVFAPQDTIHAVVAVADVPAGTKFKVVWLVDDVGDAAEPNTKIAEYELDAEGTRNLDFTLAPNNAWPVGSYKGELYVNGNLEQMFKYTISE